MLSISPVVAEIEKAWVRIRRHHQDLPDPVLTLGQGSDRRTPGTLRRGHWAPNRWVSEAGDHHEVMIAGERLEDGPDGVLATLLHEAAHGLAHVRDIKDTSRQGRYHNKRYKALAEEVLLDVEKDDQRGWTVTELTTAARRRYAAELRRLDDAIAAYRIQEWQATGGAGGGSGESRKSRRCYTCACATPRKIYVAPGVAELGPLFCGICEQEFAEGGDAA